MKNDNGTKKAELRTVVARKKSPLGVLAALVLIRLFGREAWFVKATNTLFVNADRIGTSTRTDIVSVGPNSTFAADGEKTEADAVARHLGVHKMPSVRGLLSAIRQSVQRAASAVFTDAPAEEIPVTPVTETLRTLRLIVTHRAAHLDEMVAILEILLWGNGRLFQWEEIPTVIFSENEKEALKEYSQRSDVYFVGIGSTGRGRKALVSDEHRTTGRLADTCAADLVAKRLKIDREPSLQWLLNEVRKSDVEAGQETLGLGQLLKVVQHYGASGEESQTFWLNFIQDVVVSFQRAGTGFNAPLDLGLALAAINAHTTRSDEHNLEAVGRVMDAYGKRALEFNVQCPREFKESGSVVELPGGLRLVTVTSDAYAMSAWARTQQGAHLVVQEHGTGHIRLYSTNHEKHPLLEAVMERIARHLMVHEMRAMEKSEEDIAAAWEQFPEACESSNDLPGDVPWYYLHADNSALLNGSLSHERSATRLTRTDVTDIVRDANAEVFNEQMESDTEDAAPASEEAPTV